MKHAIRFRNPGKKYIVLSILVISAIAVSSIYTVYNINSKQSPRSDNTVKANTASGLQNDNGPNYQVTVEPNRNIDKTEVSLKYVLEEEKLAHDVYVSLYNTWGAKVFDNIQRSEQEHQRILLSVMNDKNIADSRSAEIGKFNDIKLQNLYNELVARGGESRLEAYRVGVAIEELDISDITAAMNSLDDQEIATKAAYETLLNGSERHLSAFNRQLSR